MNEIKINRPSTSRLIDGKVYNIIIRDYTINHGYSKDDLKNLEYYEKGSGDRDIYLFISLETGEVIEIPKNDLVSVQEIPNKLYEIQINKPGQFIRLNLPKDLNLSINTVDNYNIEDSIKELITLNPQIPSNIIYQEHAIDDVSHESDYPISSLKDILKLYFKFLPRYLFYYYNGYNQEETEEQYDKMDRFAKEAMNGKWTLIPQITDFKNSKPYDITEELGESYKNQLLREYPESTVSKILTKWGIDPNPQSQDSKVKAARALITRFEQIKGSIPQKLDILVIPDEIKRKDPRNIELYSLEDMIKLIKSYPENPDKVKKDAIENFATKYQIDKATAQSYVARFMTKKDNLKYAVGNGTEDGNFTKDEVLELIPKRLIQNNLYLDPRNWQWQPFEQMLDALFPSQKQATGEEGDNEATTNADKVYDKGGIEIYQGDDVHKCISYNPVNTQTKRKKYGWCVTQIGNTNYDYYRFADKSPTFYFVFDRSKNSAPEHSPFQDEWHAFALQVNADGESYVITGADNRGDKKASSWEAISNIVPADTWAKIKDLKPYFKPIALSAVERGRKFASGKNLTLDEFKELNQDEKILYIQGKASKNILSNDILNILPQYKINLEGRSTTLANVAIDSGQTFPYSILKNNEALAKRYAIFRFRHTNYGSTPIPLPYVKYLDEPGQKKYYEEFDKGGSEESFLSFELIERYFGKEVTKQYVNSQLKHLGFLPPEAVNYIDNPKLKTLFKAVSKLYEPWKYGKYTNISDEELADARSQPPQDVTPTPIDIKQWAKLTPEERKIVIEVTERYNGNSDYLELIYASPFIIKDKGQTLILLPEPNSSGEYEKWVLIDAQNKVIKRNISGNSTLDGDKIVSGYTNGATDDLKRVYDMSELEIEESDSKSLDEIQIKKPGGSLEIIKWNNDWGLLVKNKYLFGDTYHHPSRPKLDKYKIIYANVDIEEGDFNKYLNIYIPEPSFWGGVDRNEIDEAYNEYEKDLKITKELLEPHSSNFTEDSYNINLNKIFNIDLIPTLNEIQIKKPGDLSNPIYLKMLLDKIPSKKYFQVIKDEEEDNIILNGINDVVEDGEVVDWLYDPIFDNELKGKPGIEEDNFDEWVNIERNKNGGEIGPLGRLLIDKILSIIEDYRFLALIPGISDFTKSVNEIQIKKPGSFSYLISSYQKYLDSISRAEMFDESGNYNSTLKGYHDKLKQYAKNGTKEEQLKANFILGLMSESKSINEIQINKPNKTWDFTKYIPDFDVKKLKVGDIIIMPQTNPITPHGKLRVSYISNFDDTIIFNGGGFLYKYNLLSVNKKNKEKLGEIQIKDGNDLWESIKSEFESDIKELLDEIQINKPNKTWDFTKYIPDFDVKKLKVGDILIWPKGFDKTEKLKIKSINEDSTISFTDSSFLYDSDLIKKNKYNKIDPEELDEIQINNPNNPENIIKRLLNNISDEKYFQILSDYEGEEQWDHLDLLEVLYDSLFDNELKGKPGVKYNSYQELIDDEDEKYNGETGPLDFLITSKAVSIVNAYVNSRED